MKAIQGVLGLLILAGLVFLAIQYFGTSRLDREVGKQGEMIQQVSQRSAEISEAVGSQGKLLEATRDDVRRHQAGIEDLEKRVTATEAEARGLREQVATLESAAEKDGTRLGKLEGELKALDERSAQQARELQDLRKALRERDGDLERRLRELEKRLQLSSAPEP